MLKYSDFNLLQKLGTFYESIISSRIDKRFSWNEKCFISSIKLIRENAFLRTVVLTKVKADLKVSWIFDKNCRRYSQSSRRKGRHVVRRDTNIQPTCT